LSTKERVVDWIDSLKVAVTVVAVETPDAFGAGVSAVTVGGVVSVAVVLYTTSTQ
jgi:hypothetical protein